MDFRNNSLGSCHKHQILQSKLTAVRIGHGNLSKCKNRKLSKCKQFVNGWHGEFIKFFANNGLIITCQLPQVIKFEQVDVAKGYCHPEPNGREFENQNEMYLPYPSQY